MRTLALEPLTAAAFAPFGDVLVPPRNGGERHYFERALRNARDQARPSLSLTCVDEAVSLPFEGQRMERHQFSSQSFMPLAATPYLVLVAPHAVGGGPDMAEARAFLAEGGIGVTYAADTWHHPLTVVAAPAVFAIWMWLDGTTDDEEFADIEPLLLRA